MFGRLSLKTRVNLIIASILGLIVILGNILVIHHARESVAEETESALRLSQETIEASRLLGPIPDSQAEHWMVLMERLNRTRHVKLHVSENDSRPPWLPGTPHVRGIPKWFVAAVAPPRRMVELQIPTQEGSLMRVFMMADPADEIIEAWNETWMFFALILLLAIGFFVSLSWVIGRAFHPVDAILEGLVALEEGNYQHRLADFPQPEWTRIATAFNHCAAMLEQSKTDNLRLTKQLLMVEEEERRTLACELHDELGQTLSAIKVMALSLQQHRRKEQIKEALELICQQVDHLFETLQSMTQRLRPLMLDDLGLTAAIDSLISSWQQKQGIKTQIQLECDPRIDSLPKEKQIHVYRIIQEGLTNVFRHAKARSVRINLALEEGPPPRLTLMIKDDGIGCDHPHSTGFGLRGMRERVNSLGGHFKLSSAAGQGFTIHIDLPFVGDEKTFS